ncbi:MAG: Transmembrane transcriptional regulator (anti-sigma factor RsiW) [Chloroflexi bacterium]|jgi:anti-sigma factor RsiW|nr:MAG: Transmembrane transcriptional regulator (anti-sigma factor RsiW) [Chloroflexota bacterium]
MMEHNNIQELLSAYANDELARTQREFVEQHLPSCPSCQAELNDYRWVRSRVGLLATVPAESDIKGKTMASIRTIAAQNEGVYAGNAKADWRRRLGIHRLPRPALVIAAVAAVIITPLALQLTGGGPGGGIASAYAATEALGSFRMSGTTVSSFGGSTSEVAFNWDFVAPDRYKGALATPAGLQEFVIVGDEQYSRLPENAGNGVTVIEMDGYSVFSPVPTRAGTLLILDSLTGVETLPDVTVDGIPTLHYQGAVDVDRIIDEQAALLNPGASDYLEQVAALDYQRSVKIDVELWINADDSTLRQMTLNTEAPTFVSDENGSRFEGVSTFSTAVKFSDLNAPFSIDPPMDENGELQSGWQASGSAPAPAVQKEVR